MNEKIKTLTTTRPSQQQFGYSMIIFTEKKPLKTFRKKNIYGYSKGLISTFFFFGQVNDDHQKKKKIQKHFLKIRMLKQKKKRNNKKKKKNRKKRSFDQVFFMLFIQNLNRCTHMEDVFV